MEATRPEMLVFTYEINHTTSHRNLSVKFHVKERLVLKWVGYSLRIYYYKTF
jgi:uncharacterized protein with WD repeat